jgi:hypothetical protein
MTRTLHVCLAFVVAALSSPAAYGFCLDNASGTQSKVFWPTVPITFKIHDTGSVSGPLGTSAPQPDKTSEQAAVRAAFAEWAAASCAKIQFTDGGLIATGDPVNLQQSADPAIHVYWARDTTEWGTSSTASIAKTWYNADATGKINSAAILINAIDKVYSTTGEGNKYDVQSVVATEVGRVLGLWVTTDAASVMYRFFQAGSVSKRTLSTDDEAGAAYLYPDPAGFDGGTCTAGTPNGNCDTSTSQQDGGTAQEDGGTAQQDGGGGDDGGGNGDGGSGYCDNGNQCASGVCDVNHQCVPKSDDGGCAVSSVGRASYLGLSLLALALALSFALRRKQ